MNHFLLDMTFKEWRKMKGYSQLDIARMLNVSQRLVSWQEAGLRPFTDNNIRYLRTATGLSTEEIIVLWKNQLCQTRQTSS